MIKRVFIAVGVIVLLAGCGGSSSPESVPTTARSGSTVTIALGIYSGRPDPTWTLSAEEVGELDAGLAKLRVKTGRMPDRGLGYHGFSIESADGTSIAVAGTVTTLGLEHNNVRVDPDRSVERLLLETGKPHLAPAEYQEVERALG